MECGRKAGGGGEGGLVEVGRRKLEAGSGRLTGNEGGRQKARDGKGDVG